MMKIWKKEIILLLCAIVGVMAMDKESSVSTVQTTTTTEQEDTTTFAVATELNQATTNESIKETTTASVETTENKSSSLSEKDKEKCWGCLEHIDQIKIPMKTLCGHMACSDCFYDCYVTRRRQTCAICRENLSDKLFQTIIRNNKIGFLHHMFAQDASHFGKITRKGNIFLQLAVKYNLFEMTEFLLIESGANPNICNMYGKTALSTARTNGNQQIADLLMAHDAIDYNNGECLHCKKNLLNLNIIETNCHHEYCAECFLNFLHEKNVSGFCKCGKHITTQSLFSKAMQFKNLEFMKHLIFVNPGITAIKDENGDFLLHHIKKEWIELITVFLENGLDTNKKDKNKNTLLHIAVKMQSISFVEALLKNGKINIMLKNKDKKTAFDLANNNMQIKNLLANYIAKNSPEVADYFIQRYYYSVKSIITENIYAWIVQNKLLDLVKLLYEKDNEIQLEKDIHGETLLTIASKQGWIELVKFLLGNFLSPILKFEGKNALLGAIQHGHKKIIELLDSAGAFLVINDDTVNAIVSKCDAKMLYFLLKIAVQKQNHNLATILLSNGAKTSPPSYVSDSPLITAVRNKDEAMVKILLQFGTNNVNFRTKNGESALSIAAQHGFSNMVELLILNGAIKEHFTNQHHTPLSLAVSQNHIKVVEILFTTWIDPNSFEEGFKYLMPIFNVKSRDMAELLIENDARTEDIFDENGKSPLTYAASNGNLDLIEFFLLHGCDCNHKDNFGEWPMLYAIQNGHHDVVHFLQNCDEEETRKRKREFKHDLEENFFFSNKY